MSVKYEDLFFLLKPYGKLKIKLSLIKIKLAPLMFPYLQQRPAANSGIRAITVASTLIFNCRERREQNRKAPQLLWQQAGSAALLG